MGDVPTPNSFMFLTPYTEWAFCRRTEEKDVRDARFSHFVIYKLYESLMRAQKMCLGFKALATECGKKIACEIRKRGHEDACLLHMTSGIQ